MNEPKQVFEIEQYKTIIKVKPYQGLPIDVDENWEMVAGHNYQGERRVVHPNTEARLFRSVEFSSDNKRQDKFEIRYGTLKNGVLTARHSPARNLLEYHLLRDSCLQASVNCA